MKNIGRRPPRLFRSSFVVVPVMILAMMMDIFPSRVRAQTSVCNGWEVPLRFCVEDFVTEFSDFLLGTTQNLIPIPAGDLAVQWMYDLFFVPLRDILVTLLRFDELPVPSVCWGDFSGSEINADVDLVRHGCGFLPVMDTQNYGIFAASFPIPVPLQVLLIPTGLWTIPRPDPVVPDVCVAFHTPAGTECSSAAFAATLNEQVLVTLSEAVPLSLLFPPFSGVADGLLSFLSVLAESGLDQFNFGLSLGDTGLQVPTFYYRDGSFLSDPFITHVYFTVIGSVELPFLPQGINDLLSIDGAFDVAFNLGGQRDGVEKILESVLTSPVAGLNALPNYLPRLLAFPNVITTTGRVHIDLRELTFGLLQGITLRDVSVSALMVPPLTTPILFGTDEDPGLYLAVGNEARAIQDVATELCSYFDGVLRLVSGQGCPSFEWLGLESALGLTIRPHQTDFELTWQGLFIQCTAKANFILPSITCSFNGVIFMIVEQPNLGYSIGKALDFGAVVVEEVVTEVSDEAVNILHGFTSALVSVAALTSNTAQQVTVAVLNVFFQGIVPPPPYRQRRQLVDHDLENLLQEDQQEEDDAAATDEFVHKTYEGLDFNFRPGRTCVGPTIDLFRSGDKSIRPHYWEQLGNDGSKASCLAECYLFMQQESLTIMSPYTNKDVVPCCAYTTTDRTVDDQSSCSVGFEGTEPSTDERSLASVTFEEDFEKVNGERDVGESCEKDSDCFFGHCGMGGVCYLECTKSFKCYPNQVYQKCRGDDEACLDMHHVFHYCDPETDTCKSSGGAENVD